MNIVSCRARFLVKAAICLICAVLLQPPAYAQMQTLQVQGHAIKLEAPEGHCSYSADNEKDAALLAQLEHANEGKRQVLLAFSNCADRDAMRAGKPQVTGDYGHVMTPIFSDAGSDRGPGAEEETREHYAAQMADDLAARYGPLESDASKLNDSLIDAVLQTGTVKVLGVIPSTPDLAQTATFENLEAPGKSARVLGVITHTKFDVPVLIAFYHIIAGSEDASLALKALAASSASYARALIALQSNRSAVAGQPLLPLLLSAAWLIVLTRGLAFVRRKPRTNT